MGGGGGANSTSKEAGNCLWNVESKFDYKMH